MIFFDKDTFKRSIQDNVKLFFRKKIGDASKSELFQAVAYAVKDQIIDEWIATHKAYEQQDAKILYYMSMEFLMGRALGNMLINMNQYDGVKEVLSELGLDLNELEDQEPDPALGNGGLGRLAACFLDSLATLGYGAYGCGIRYKYGMFAQRIRDGFQVEVPDNWLKDGNPFEIRRPEYACKVKFGGQMDITSDKYGKIHYDYKNYNSVLAVPYDMPIVGYGSGVVNTLRIWDAEPINTFNLDSFDRGDYAKAIEQENLAKTIVEVLYPNDNHTAGKLLRLKQQYFFVSATVQTAIKKYRDTHNGSLKGFEKKVVFQMNDTHPTLTVPELMRLLMDENGYEWDEAWEIVKKTCAYTNHTIMQEAMEKWPVDLFRELLPRVYSIIEEIDKRFAAEIEEKYPGDYDRLDRMRIINHGQIRMAFLAIVGSFSVNGVAQVHTEILKARELHDFYEHWPEKFNNKTNGITQRRFLAHGNPLLADFVTRRIGNGWMTDLREMERLTDYLDDEMSLHEFADIKYQNKIRLAQYVKQHNGIDIDPFSIYDVQVKRLHEYKRQLMNILHVMYLYQKIKNDRNFAAKFYPRTFIFGAKAAAGYHLAKLTIKLINDVANVVNRDPSIHGKLRVVFIEDYKVSNAELIFAAADVSEQISTASKEASGTSNMKFMLNGAPTLGTMDGANIEIVEEVGRENAFIFGLTPEEVINYEKNGGYYPEEIFSTNDELRDVLMQLVNGTFSPENPELYRDLYASLLRPQGSNPADRYFILKDFMPYHEASMRVNDVYKDRSAWTKMCLLQVAKCGKFSSDRTISEYVRDIWHLDPIIVQEGD